MIEIKSIENLIEEKSKVLAEIESLKAEQIFVDKIKSFALVPNEYIEQLEAENAELRKDKERLDWIEGNQGKIGIGDHVPITTIGDTT